MTRSLVAIIPLLLLATAAHAGEPAPRVERFPENPIIRPDMLPGTEGRNINGPSLIRAPEWLPGRLGNYYLYFAHHGGKSIRLAYADNLHGPWKIYKPGTLQLDDAPACKGHVASPDVHVDVEHRQIRMYFHAPARAGGGQQSFVALSSDGLHFKPEPEPLGLFYFRAFQWQGTWYALAKRAWLFGSPTGLKPFERGPNPFPGEHNPRGDQNRPGPRHVAVQRDGDRLWIYYSNIGDAPERILRTHLTLNGDWTTWKTSPPQEVLRPELPYEGAELPLKPSIAGAMRGRENALRDPAVFVDADGKVYLLYSVAGEAGIGIAQIENAP